MRSPRALLLLSEGTLALLALAGGLAFGLPADPPQAAPVEPKITRCDLGTQGAARVTYTITNGDRVVHGYRVELTVATGTAPVGWGISLVSRVAPGATATVQAMLPLTGDPAGAKCTASASVFDGRTGHHD